MAPAYSITITIKNDADFPLTFTGHGGQTGSDFEKYPPQVISGHSSETFKETLDEIKDSKEGNASWNMLDQENFDFVDLKLTWLSGQEPSFKAEITGDDNEKYELTSTVDGSTTVNVTITLSKK
ncbi:hypothetical protein TWF569_006757 [Orbilia oligospora]|uniref:Uncharacterized protein n=1 Tax=Orbilia oligospora TaxID=2813651 RepID=A0A7C8JJW2_ORBOL|nr:hypothetical protein TWF102_006416 [Orbilia oligospora]KAF3109726.1 hypothetical protein TWF103_005086 [Orbilia oligospora]KAF3156167.1 hypothetical protein TWF569_006757 [Orbilia oligospora]